MELNVKISCVWRESIINCIYHISINSESISLISNGSSAELSEWKKGYIQSSLNFSDVLGVSRIKGGSDYGTKRHIRKNSGRL